MIKLGLLQLLETVRGNDNMRSNCQKTVQTTLFFQEVQNLFTTELEFSLVKKSD